MARLWAKPCRTFNAPCCTTLSDSHFFSIYCHLLKHIRKIQCRLRTQQVPQASLLYTSHAITRNNYATGATRCQCERTKLQATTSIPASTPVRRKSMGSFSPTTTRKKQHTCTEKNTLRNSSVGASVSHCYHIADEVFGSTALHQVCFEGYCDICEILRRTTKRG